MLRQFERHLVVARVGITGQLELLAPGDEGSLLAAVARQVLGPANGGVHVFEIEIERARLHHGPDVVRGRAAGGFVERHPTVKMLALSFLLLIGMTLIAEGWELHIPRGYVYSAMAFSVFVELLNLRAKKTKGPPVKLHEPYV